MDNRRSFLGHLAALFAWLWRGNRDPEPAPGPSLEREIDVRFTMIAVSREEQAGKWHTSADGVHWRQVSTERMPTLFGRTLLRCEWYDPMTVTLMLAQFHCVDGEPVSAGRARCTPNDVRLAWGEMATHMKSRDWIRGAA